MKHLTRTQIGALREQMVAREALLAGEIERAMAERSAREPEGREVDPGVVDLDSVLAIADVIRDQHEVDHIRAALGRMDRGTYGRCLNCGTSIPLERLRAQPDAEYCHVCQTRAEGG